MQGSDSLSTDVLALLRRRAANNMWSNARLHAVCAKLSEPEYLATRTSFFPSIPATLNHILIVDWFYLDALLGEGKGRALFVDEVPMKSMQALAAAQRVSDARLVEFTAKLDGEASLTRRVTMARREGLQHDSVLNVLSHLDVHQIHHRGQVHAMLAGTSEKPPALDEFFMAAELPLREAELRELGLPLE